MVDLTKPFEEYDFSYFNEINEEIKLYPHFLALQRKYFQVGNFLKIKEQDFLLFAKKWSTIQNLTTSAKELTKEPRLPCSEKERADLLKSFLLKPLEIKSPKDVFTNFHK